MRLSRNDYGFVRVAAVVPRVYPASPDRNIAEMIPFVREAAEKQTHIIAFPELGITGYTCQDLFHQFDLIYAARQALIEFVNAAHGFDVISIVGLPYLVDDNLFNAAAVCHRGRILGIAVKTYIPNYNELYELRWFAPASRLRTKELFLCEETVPIGNDLVFNAGASAPHLAFDVEICEDGWVPISPGTLHALAGSKITFNLSASNETIGKTDFRTDTLARSRSALNISGYVYVSLTSSGSDGSGESASDLVFGGHAAIAENGQLLGESERFSDKPQLLAADIDIEALMRDRMHMNSFGQCAELTMPQARYVPFQLPWLDAKYE